jgi:hypothetical protein
MTQPQRVAQFVIALTAISRLPLPTATIAGVAYVPLACAEALRTIATDALAFPPDPVPAARA